MNAFEFWLLKHGPERWKPTLRRRQWNRLNDALRGLTVSFERANLSMRLLFHTPTWEERLAIAIERRSIRGRIRRVRSELRWRRTMGCFR